MKQWFQNLSAREKSLISVGGVIVIILLVYLFLIEPVNHSIDRLNNQVHYNHTLLTWMEQANEEIQAFPKMADGQQKPSIAGIQAALTQQGFSTHGVILTQKNATTYEIQLKQAPFDKFIGAIVAGHQQFGLKVSKLAFKQAGAGLVTGSATLLAQP